MTPLSLDVVLADIRQLPSLPAVVSELITTLESEAAGVDQLAAGIGKDQSLTARALRVANSPFYGVQHKVASVHDAIVILGYRAVASLVTAASVTGFFSPPADAAFDLTRFWRHGIGAALCARALARHCGVEPEAAFTAGLLHDIGVLVLLTTRPEHYAAVLEHRARQDCELVAAERELLGFDHARVGEALALRWHFPAEIARGVALHHAPQRLGDDEVERAGLVDVAHVANVLAHALDLAQDPDALVPPLDPGAWRRIGLEAAGLKAMLTEIELEHACYCTLLAA